MNLKENEIIDLLENANIPKESYSLYGSDGNDVFGIDHQGNEWLLYYSERGVRKILKTFNTKEEAYGKLYAILINSFTTPVKNTDENRIVLKCTCCKNELKLPILKNEIKVKCPKCNCSFFIDLKEF